ncbi:MAG: YbaB/EbfC family nucleoid-associated protein [Maricaulaceae bacterium]|jgi:DNA-binding YbaB/EbfC family protein
MKDLAGLVQQAQKMQAELKRAEEELEAAEVEGESGAGLVKVVLSGKGATKRVAIDPSLMKPEDAPVLEDLLVAALNDAKAKADELSAETMKDAAGGLASMLPPGFKPPF